MKTVTVTIRMPPQHRRWLRALAKASGVTGAGWVRRQVKIAAQCARLPGAVTRRASRGVR